MGLGLSESAVSVGAGTEYRNRQPEKLFDAAPAAPSRIRLWAWAPVPLFLVLILVFRIWGPNQPFESVLIGLASNILLSSIASLLVVYLVATGFLKSGSPALLFLSCGVLTWACAGALALYVGEHDANVMVSIHNLGAALAGGCHLAGVLLIGRRRWVIRWAGLVLPLALAGTLGAIVLIVLVSRAQILPVFFVPNQGGTWGRQVVLGAAVLMFAAAAAALTLRPVLRDNSFEHWYGLALALVAVGLFGVMIQSNVGSAVSWLGRSAQFLSGIYMVVAAIAGLREANLLTISLQASLQESERRFRALVMASSEIVYCMSPDWSEMRRLIGHDFVADTERPDRNWMKKFIHPDDQATALSAIAEAVRGKVAFEFEHRVLRADGRVAWMFSRAVPIKDQNGEIVEWFGMASDITRRKVAEDEREGLLRKLRQTQEQLYAELDAKNGFLAALSHELRNPLAPITNSLFVLDHAPAESEQAERAKKIIARQVGQLSALVNDLLDITRITRNKIQLNKEQLDLNEIVRLALEDNRSYFDLSHVTLELVPSPQPVFVLADRTRIVQIVGNLLSNSAKFTGQGGHARVSIACEDHEAVLRVSDDGIGMDAQIVRRLFEPFMQAAQTLDRSQGGLGLGLALVKGLVELHGGRVSAHSEGPGKGAELAVRLPLAAATAVQPAAPQVRQSSPRRRVLIIEDNVDAANSLREALEFAEHHVEVAYTGFDGVAKAKRCRPEVILCDIGLPQMDGYQVARALRADKGFEDVYLVALSGYAQPEDREHAAQAGFDRHLSKPPSLEALERIMLELAPPRSPTSNRPEIA